MSETAPFFRIGGTLDPASESYISREADDALFEALLAGEYVFLLDSRQKGKSSMVARAIVRLKEAGVTAIKLDLQRIGANVTPDQWYAGLLGAIAEEVGLAQEVFKPLDVGLEGLGGEAGLAVVGVDDGLAVAIGFEGVAQVGDGASKALRLAVAVGIRPKELLEGRVCDFATLIQGQKRQQRVDLARPKARRVRLGRHDLKPPQQP